MSRLEDLIKTARSGVARLEKDASEAERQLQDVTRRLEIEKARMEGLEQAMAAVRADGQGRKDPDEVNFVEDKGLGRPVGAFSPQWRQVLRKMADANGKVFYPKIIEFARKEGIRAGTSSIRDRIRSYVTCKLVIGSSLDGFVVDTNQAQQRGVLDGTET